MRRGRAIGFTAMWAWIGLAATGCTHNHYYYTTPGAVGVPAAVGPCDPAPAGTVISSARPVISTPMLGAVCDEPPGGAAVATRATPIASNAGGPINPVPAGPIYSRPIGRPLRRGGLAWRGSNTESLATTRVEGDYGGETSRQ